MIDLRAETFVPKEVAERTGFSVSTLAKWRCQGKGPSWIKIAGRIRYERSALEAWIASETARAA